jgi:transposase
MSGSGAAYSASIAAWPSAQVVAARNRGRTVLRSTQRFAWRMLPRDFPPVTTVQRYLYAWRDSGLSSTINHLLLMAVRLASGREASPTAGRNRQPSFDSPPSSKSSASAASIKAPRSDPRRAPAVFGVKLRSGSNWAKLAHKVTPRLGSHIIGDYSEPSRGRVGR